MEDTLWMLVAGIVWFVGVYFNIVRLQELIAKQNARIMKLEYHLHNILGEEYVRLDEELKADR